MREMLIGCKRQVEETQELAVKLSKGLGKVEWYDTLTLSHNPDLCGSSNNMNFSPDANVTWNPRGA
jgi:hypothetical protein